MNVSEIKTTDCFGCGACFNLCKQKAISFEKNALGFMYPVVDQTKCVECGICLRGCPTNIDGASKSARAFFAFNKETEIQRNSSSAGAAYNLSKWFLLNGGIVFGCAWENSFRAKHVFIDKVEDLFRLQKSKYVQSDLSSTFLAVRNALLLGKKVLFFGTPCQVAAIKSFLSKDNVSNLFCVDLVCHGVPSNRFLKEFINYTEERKNITIKSIDFRHKIWDRTQYITKIDFMNKRNKEKTALLHWSETSYMYFFMLGYSLRESCYHCKFSSKNREGDITLGDYWLQGANKKLDSSNGISLILINTVKGNSFKGVFENTMLLTELDSNSYRDLFEQLSHPCEKPKDYDAFKKSYVNKGYGGAEEFFSIKNKQRLTTHIKLFFIRRTPLFLIKLYRRAKKGFKK